ncbi:MAG: hypothetical protein P4L56_20300 [Candidatus Sulfopaludibacter sp.]|nr:hypothetical protein [Candidatus Sulfopaludibacter sp.]
MRSLYVWRGQYLRSGFAGIVRRRRNDRGCPKRFSESVMVRLIDAATRVRDRGDVALEYRAFRSVMTYKTCWQWIRRLQTQLRVIEMPQRGDHIDLVF